MSLVFYYTPMSTAMITEAVLAELGTPHETVKMDLKAGDTKKAEFLKINPNGRVPTIVHEGTPIWESAAITMYLGEVFGVSAGLYPAEGPKRGEAMKWIVWSNVNLAAAGSRLGAAMAPGSEAAAENAKGDISSCLKVLNSGGLEGKAFLLGEYSLADTHLHSVVSWLGMMHVDLQPFPNIASWVKRVSERPALVKLMEGYKF